MRAAAALLFAAGASAYPVYLECANDTATRLKVGGGAIMAGPPAACSGSCAMALDAAVDAAGATTLTITTSADGINFAVRVNDGAGVLSSTDAALKSTIGCDGQMYTVGAAAAPPPGSFKVVLTPGAGAAKPVFTVAFTDKFGVPLSVVTHPPSGPPPAPPAQLYKCTKGQCAANTAGVPLDTCQALCSPTPPAPAPPAALYKCTQGQCVEGPVGVDLPTCQSLCKAPAPPPAPGALYRCKDGTCTASDAGVDLATCQSLCKAPAPPGQKYRCSGNQCVAADDGVDLPTCQSLCKAPSPPAPVPPTPAGPPLCTGGCLECIEDFVLLIFESATSCLTAKVVGCVENILADIYNGIEMITSCGSASASNRAALTSSAGIARLRALAAGSGDERLRLAAARLPHP